MFIQDVDNNQRDDVIVVDAYDGSVIRVYSNITSFNIASLVDAPWRTTLGGNQFGRSSGAASWLYYGQEFKWIQLTNLNQWTASATDKTSLPRE
jgi:hypothetical protein